MKSIYIYIYMRVTNNTTPHSPVRLLYTTVYYVFHGNKIKRQELKQEMIRYEMNSINGMK